MMVNVESNERIDVRFVESIKVDSSVFLVRMASGAVHIVSPAVAEQIEQIKKQLDNIKTEQAY